MSCPCLFPLHFTFPFKFAPLSSSSLSRSLHNTAQLLLAYIITCISVSSREYCTYLDFNIHQTSQYYTYLGTLPPQQKNPTLPCRSRKIVPGLWSHQLQLLSNRENRSYLLPELPCLTLSWLASPVNLDRNFSLFRSRPFFFQQRNQPSTDTPFFAIPFIILFPVPGVSHLITVRVLFISWLCFFQDQDQINQSAGNKNAQTRRS